MKIAQDPLVWEMSEALRKLIALCLYLFFEAKRDTKRSESGVGEE